MQACGPVVRPHEILQTLIISIPQPSAAVKSFFELSRNFGAPEAISALLLYRQQTADLPPIQRCAAGGERGPPGTGDIRHDMACALPPPGGGGKRGRDTKVSLPLLTPQPFLRTRLPSVARLNARGPQGRLVLQGHTLDRSGAFRSDGVRALHCLAAHCYARQITQSKFRA